jgi:hypothetical protein
VGAHARKFLVSPAAPLAPMNDGGGDWAVEDRGAEIDRAPLDQIRVSALWKTHLGGGREAQPGHVQARPDAGR